jgi:hypothetical protein
VQAETVVTGFKRNLISGPIDAGPVPSQVTVISANFEEISETQR